jgi:hypothetical protein
MNWLRLAVVLMALVVAAWLAFDGGHGLVTGDYVTPQTGTHAGELGPWSAVVEAAGIDPRSRLMMTVHAVVGFAGLVAVGGFLMEATWSWWAMVGFAVASLWYLPFGTLLSAAQLGLLTLTPLRHAAGARSNSEV